MHVGAADHPDRRGTLEAVLLDVPARRTQHGATGRGQRGEVGHRGAAHEADGGPSGQAEELDQPFRGHLLDDSGRGVPRYKPTFWSQVEVSQSAASAAGTDPPITKPK